MLPETAAPSPGAFEERFRALGDAGADGIVCINLSSRLSGTMQSAQVAAKALEGELPVTVVDSMSVSMGLGNQCIAAQRDGRRGRRPRHHRRARPSRWPSRTRLFGALDTLEHLRRGGRIGGAQAMLGSMLSIKPVIEVRDGVVAESGKVRTRSKSLAHLAEKLARRQGPAGTCTCSTRRRPTSTSSSRACRTIVPRDQIELGEIGPVIGTHAGPRTIGLGWVDAP